MKYKVGDSVRVRTLSSLIAEYGIERNGNMNVPTWYFSLDTYELLSGKLLMVRAIDTDETVMVEDESEESKWVPECVLEPAEEEAAVLPPAEEEATVIPPAEGTAATQEHYKKAAMQPLQVMQTILSPEQFKGFLLGNVVKYLMRADFKGQTGADYGKARQYYYWYSLVKDDESRKINPAEDIPPTGFVIRGII